MCDFAGYIEPEIVKRRRVIVVSPRNPGAQIVLVVPVSTTAPRSLRAIHVHFPPNAYPCFGEVDAWAKADLLAHVRLERLDRVKVRGLGYLRTVKLKPEDYRKVQQAVLHALGLGELTLP